MVIKYTRLHIYKAVQYKAQCSEESKGEVRGKLGSVREGEKDKDQPKDGASKEVRERGDKLRHVQ